MDFKAMLRGILKPGSRGAERAAAQLRDNARKALRMKNAAAKDPVPPHRTAHGGMRDNSAAGLDHTPAREGSFTPEHKRSKVHRSGDAS